MTDVMLSS